MRMIETIFEQMALVLLNERGQLSVVLKTRYDRSVARPAAAAQGDPPNPASSERRICFPGKTEREAWRFGAVRTRMVY